VRAELVLPGEISSLIQDPTFRVVLWNRPARAGDAWFHDEWQIDDARDVREVVEWAEAQGATTFEVLIRWDSAGRDGNGDPCGTFGYVRVAGEPGEDGFTERVERFVAD
jgi:hypothetical protein